MNPEYRLLRILLSLFLIKPIKLISLVSPKNMFVKIVLFVCSLPQLHRTLPGDQELLPDLRGADPQDQTPPEPETGQDAPGHRVQTGPRTVPPGDEKEERVLRQISKQR